MFRVFRGYSGVLRGGDGLTEKWKRDEVAGNRTKKKTKRKAIKL